MRNGLFVIGLAALASTCSAGVITFDEFPAMDNGAALTTAYSGIGVTFDDRNTGTWDGIDNGDPGGWGVNGTNGPNFLGNNGGNNGETYAESIFFAVGQATVSFDASRTGGSSSGQTLTANAYDGSNNLIDSVVLTLGNVNAWTAFSVSGAGIARVDVIGSTSGFSPYAIDNLQFTSGSASVPEPGSILLLAIGVAGLAGVKRARSRKA